MIRNWLLVIVALAIGAAAAFYLREETGYVLVSFRGWIVETSLLGLIVAAVLGLLLAWAAARLIFGSVRLPSAVRALVDRRRHDRAQRAFETGTLRLIEGDWKAAEIELVRRAADHHAPHLNYLWAARAAQRLGAGDRRDHYLHLAATVAPDMERATLLTRARLQIERGEFAAARDTVLQLRSREPRHLLAVELQAEALYGLRDWEALRQLLITDQGVAAIAPARHRELLEHALIERLRGATADARLDQVKALWNDAPSTARQWPALRLAYAQSLARLNAQAEAIALVSATLNREWDAGLARLYGELEPGDAVAQLAAIEQWLGRHGEQPELLLAAGRACLRNRLWGKARSYLDAVERIAPSAAVYLSLAQVCEQTQNAEEAQKFYRKGLAFAAQ